MLIFRILILVFQLLVEFGFYKAFFLLVNFFVSVTYKVEENFVVILDTKAKRFIFLETKIKRIDFFDYTVFGTFLIHIMSTSTTDRIDKGLSSNLSS